MISISLERESRLFLVNYWFRRRNYREAFNGNKLCMNRKGLEWLFIIITEDMNRLG